MSELVPYPVQIHHPSGNGNSKHYLKKIVCLSKKQSLKICVFFKPTLFFLLLILCARSSFAVDMSQLPLFSITDSDDTKDFSINLQILFVLTALTLLPSAILCMTCFTRIVIVLTILRQALGLQQTPPNRIILGLSLFMTLFIMQPVFERLWTDAIDPWMQDKMSFKEALIKARVPIHLFMEKQTRKSDLDQFVILSGSEPYNSTTDIPLTTLIPAFLTSELKTAFQIGFLIFLPFLIIDLIIASLLMTLGMIMLSPMLVSLPLKLMMFVLVDGWNLMVGSLAHSVSL